MELNSKRTIQTEVAALGRSTDENLELSQTVRGRIL